MPSGTMMSLLRIPSLGWLFAGLAVSGCIGVEVSAEEEILIPGKDTFPESITIADDGQLFVSSPENGSIYTARRGDTVAVPWIAGEAGWHSFGLAHSPDSKTLYICQVSYADGPQAGPSASRIMAYEIATGVSTSEYRMPPPPSMCNDIAVDRDGTLYVSDYGAQQILTFRGGGYSVCAESDRLAGVDGIAISRAGTVFAATYRSGELYRIDCGDSALAQVQHISLPRLLDRPDGLRMLPSGDVIVAEGGRGEVTRIRIEGNRGELARLGASAGPSSLAIDVGGDALWILDGKVAYAFDPKRRPTAAPFKIFRIVADQITAGSGRD